MDYAEFLLASKIFKNQISPSTGVSSVNGQSGIVTLTTDDIPETATHVYFTDTIGSNLLTAAHNDAASQISSATFTSAKITDFNTAVNALIGAATINAATLQGQSGAYYLSRANHTGTQLANTISNFSAAVVAALPQPIATTSTPTFSQLTVSSDGGMKLIMIDGPTALHGYQSWYLSDAVTRKGYFGFPSPGSTTLSAVCEAGGTLFGAKTGATHDFQVNSSSIFNIASSAITANVKIQCATAPASGDDLTNKTYVDSLTGLLPTWANTYTANAGRDRYFRAQNTQVSTSFTGYLIETGVYNQYTTPTNFTTAPWFVGLSQASIPDNDECGVGQFGIGMYMSSCRRNQTKLGLNTAFEPRGTTGGHNRDDLRVLMNTNAMIKGYEPELFFNNTNQSGLNMQNGSIRMNDQGLCFYGFNSNWDSRTLAMSIFTNPIGQEISMFAKLLLSGGLVLPSDTPAPTNGAVRYDGINVQIHNGLIWRTLAYV